jgi:hypothetical protein
MTVERSVPSTYIVANVPRLLEARTDELQRLQERQGVDFAFQVQRFMSATDENPHTGGQLSVDEIERVFDWVASGCPLSSWQIKTSMKGTPLDSVEELTHLFRRMQSCEAKWIIRLPLKDLRAVGVQEVALQRFHSLLTDHLKFVMHVRPHLDHGAKVESVECSYLQTWSINSSRRFP